MPPKKQPGQHKQSSSLTPKKQPGTKKQPGRPVKPREITCPDCGQPFTPVNTNQKRCVKCIQDQNATIKEVETIKSTEFQKEEEEIQEAAEEAAKQPTGANYNKYPAIKCKDCEKDFFPRRSDQKRCEKCLPRNKAEHKSDNYKMVRVRCANPECPNGGSFETTWQKYRSGAKFCDTECRNQYSRLKSKKLQEEIEAKRRGNIPEQIIEIDYTPHSGGQQLVHASQARFKVLICGARWGKDRCLINEFIVKFAQMLSESRPSTLIPRVHGWLVAPTYPLAKQIWRELVHFWPEQWRVGKNEAEHRLETVGDGLIEVKSADNPDSLVSVGLDIVLATEVARIKDLETTWSYLRGRLSSPGRGPNGKGGIALLNSTPKGRTYLYQMYQWGLDERFPMWASFQFPTVSNPYIEPGEVEEARGTLPERLFRQEYLGEFLEDSGEVFSNVDVISIGVRQEPTPGMSYKCSWDPAQRTDYSAFG